MRLHNTIKVAAAVEQLEKNGQKITLSALSRLTGNSYQSLYLGGYKYLANPHRPKTDEIPKQTPSQDIPKIEELIEYRERGMDREWIKITETCPVCKKIARRLYWETNSSSKLKAFWTSSLPRKLHCHKVRAKETFVEGQRVKDEVSKLPPKDKARFVLSVKLK